MQVLLIDDHPIVRDGVRRILAGAFPDASFGEAGTAPEAMRMVRGTRWDVAVLDLSMPGRSGLELVKDLHQLRPRMPILVMTMYAVDQYALRSFRAGASGYVTKGSSAEELVDAVKKLVSGGKYMTTAIAEHLATTLFSRETGRPLHEALSDRELQVLRMLANGLTVKEIAFELKLSEKTVSTYRARVLQKMNMRTGAQLVRYAIRAHLVD